MNLVQRLSILLLLSTLPSCVSWSRVNQNIPYTNPNNSYFSAFKRQHYSMRIPSDALEARLVQAVRDAKLEESFVYNKDNEELIEVGTGESENWIKNYDLPCELIANFLSQVTHIHFHLGTVNVKYFIDTRDHSAESIRKIEEGTYLSVDYKNAKNESILKIMREIEEGYRDMYRISNEAINKQLFSCAFPSPTDLEFSVTFKELFPNINFMIAFEEDGIVGITRYSIEGENLFKGIEIYNSLLEKYSEIASTELSYIKSHREEFLEELIDKLESAGDCQINIETVYFY